MRAWPDLLPEDIEWILTDRDLRRLIVDLGVMGRDAREQTDPSESFWITLDIESTGLAEHAPDARLVTLALTIATMDDPHGCRNFVLPLSHPDGPFYPRWRSVATAVAAALLDAGLPLIGQNLRFDARWIFACTGIDLAGLIAWDTQLSSHLLDENRSASLKPRASETFGVERWDDFDFSRAERERTAEAKLIAGGKPAKMTETEWRELLCRHPRMLGERADFFDFGIYNVRDTYWTWALCVEHRRELALSAAGRDQHEAEEPYERAMRRLGRFHERAGVAMVRSITEMEQTGWLLDQEWTRERLASQEAIAAQSYALLEEAISGGPESYEEEFPSPRSYEPTSLWFAHWTQDLIRQGELRVMSATAKGKPSWTKAVLTKLARAGSEPAGILLRHRSATKQAQFLRSWLDLVCADGRIHPTYSYARVLTGRTSCSGPNLQQVTSELRPAFIASPGCLLIESDLSQIEMRTAAHISGCAPMIEAFRNGADLHRLMAAQMTGKRPEDVSKQERQRAKAVNFGLLFMMGPQGLVGYADAAYDVLLSIEEAEAAHAAYFALWEGLGPWHMRCIAQATREGFIASPIGRIRRLPGMIGADAYEHARLGRQAVNAPVQSLASDILQLGVDKIRSEIPQARLLGMVHDSVIVEAPAELAEKIAAEVVRCMTSLDAELLSLGCRLDVPLAAEASVGRRWSEGELLAQS